MNTLATIIGFSEMAAEGFNGGKNVGMRSISSQTGSSVVFLTSVLASNPSTVITTYGSHRPK